MKCTTYLTTYENNQILFSEQSTCFEMDNNVEMKAINLYPKVSYQTVDGFGGAITEATGFVFSQMPKEEQDNFINNYFSDNGNQYNMVRCHIDSSDFALGNYSAMNDPTDVQLLSFDLSRDHQYIIPLLKRVNEVCKGKLQIMLSPWSPPGFMKTNGAKNGGGKLLDAYRDLWAAYLCKYIKAYKEMGFNITMMTIQNEPNAVQVWDSCTYTPEEEKTFLKEFLYPEMVKQGLTEVKIHIWDHNKERLYERALEIIDEETDEMVGGIAFHWYTGDHFEAVALTRETFPNKSLVFSEGCVEYSRFGTSQLDNARMYAHDMIGNLNAGMTAYLDWNLLLDEIGGPNHVGNFCDAPVMFDTKTYAISYKLSYRYIGHMSRFIQRGAKRIGFSKFSSQLDVTSFKNPDGTIVTVIMNKTSDNMSINLRINGEVANISLPGDCIATCVIA